MNINIEMQYYTKDNIGIQRANFGVDSLEFKINPDKEAVKTAYQWFDRIRKEFPYDIKIKSVIYNRDHDITDGLKAVLEKEKRVSIEDWKAPWE